MGLTSQSMLVCEIFLGLKLDIDDDAEVVDVCNEVRRFERECIKKGEKRGIKKGEERGIIKGEKKALVEFVKRLWKKSLSILEICDYTGASEETVREIVLSFES